ncbi:MAG TPA: histidine kinase [Chryseosolibacter sp.]
MFKKAIFLFGLVFLAAFFCYSQGEKKSSERYQDYKSKLSNESPAVLLQEAEALKTSAPGKALDKVREALGLSLAGKDLFHEAKCYVVLGEINESIEEWKLAMQNYNIAYDKLKRKHKTSTEFTRTISGLANSYRKLGNYSEALKAYDELLAMNLSAEERSNALLGKSEVYLLLKDYDQAEKSVNAISNTGGASGPRGRGLDTINIRQESQRARIYAKTDEVEMAKSTIQSSQNTLSSAPSAAPAQVEDLKIAKEEVAEALHDQKLYDDEIDLRNQSIEYNLKSNNLPEVTKDKVGLSKALAAKGETSEAIRELEEAALMADTINNPKDQAKAFLSLANLYEKNGRTDKALNAFKRYSQSVNKAELQNQMKLAERADLIRKQREIEELSKDVALGQSEETLAQATVFRQQLVIYGLLLIIVIIAVTSYFIYKNAQASKIANQMLALKSLRSQMNPHFIFNALNSVNQFVAKNDERTTNKFLSDFSRLMRLVMENSQEDFIPLHKEQEIISLYLKLEHYRFRDKFDYTITIDENVNAETVEIPPMLIQPYIENAVWHGLRYKDTKGHLQLIMRKVSDGLQVEIVDDGIGRKRSAQLKTENQKKQNSTGLKNIEQRLSIINKVYKSGYTVSIEDVDRPSETGTRVIINVPERKNGHA